MEVLFLSVSPSADVSSRSAGPAVSKVLLYFHLKKCLVKDMLQLIKASQSVHKS